jgi:hypothetical protein
LQFSCILGMPIRHRIASGGRIDLKSGAKIPQLRHKKPARISIPNVAWFIG